MQVRFLVDRIGLEVERCKYVTALDHTGSDATGRRDPFPSFVHDAHDRQTHRAGGWRLAVIGTTSRRLRYTQRDD
jgi:hypothetical protein